MRHVQYPQTQESSFFVFLMALLVCGCGLLLGLNSLVFTIFPWPDLPLAALETRVLCLEIAAPNRVISSRD
jgi:hypothetical protein